MNLSKNIKIMEVEAPIALADDTDSNTDIIDMSGWDGVVFIVPVTDSVDTGVATLKAEDNSANSDTGMTHITGATATATSVANDDLNNQLLILDVYRPVERYVQGVLTSATANIAFGNTIAILYRGRKAPVTQPTATTLQHTTVVGS